MTEEITSTEITLDDIADSSIDTLQGILQYFHLDELTIDEYEGDEEELILDITGDDLAILIGRYGRTLEAIQYLVTAINYKKLGVRYPVVVDVEGYKNRQRDKIEKIAASMAQKAITKGQKVSLKPMSAYERRLVHIALKENPKVMTESEGEGQDRRVVILPV